MRNLLDNVNEAPDVDEDDALELMHSAVHVYRSLQHHMLRAAGHSITQMDSRVLRYFERHPGATLSDLAHYSGRDKAQLTRLIKGLRDQDLLASAADASDRRTVRLSLTAKGAALQRCLQQESVRLGEQAMAGLSGAQRRQLADLLRQVNRNLLPSGEK